jgi:hypothetical protein
LTDQSFNASQAADFENDSCETLERKLSSQFDTVQRYAKNAYLAALLYPPKGKPLTVLQDFEQRQSYSLGQNAVATLSTDIKYAGHRSLKMIGTGSDWPSVEVYLNRRPVDLGLYNQLCLWVYDTVGSNTLGLTLIDSTNSRDQVWSHWAGACDTPRTEQDQWVRICFNLSAFDQQNVHLDAAARVEIEMRSDGDYYFDDIRVVGGPTVHLPFVLKSEPHVH